MFHAGIEMIERIENSIMMRSGEQFKTKALQLFPSVTQKQMHA